jgi:hypothetical protein
MGAKFISMTHLLNRFFDFWRRFLRVWLQSVFGKKVSKNAEFHADFKSIEKVFKKCTIKTYKQNKFDEHE